MRTVPVKGFDSTKQSNHTPLGVLIQFPILRVVCALVLKGHICESDQRGFSTPLIRVLNPEWSVFAKTEFAVEIEDGDNLLIQNSLQGH